MTMKVLVDQLTENKAVLTTLVGVILAIVEVTPIKINPLSWVGGLFFGKRFDSLSKDVSDLKNELEERDVINKRVRIINFADEMRQFDPSKERFEQVITDIDDYEKYCKKHENFANNVAVMSIESIKQEYRRRFLSFD